MMLRWVEPRAKQVLVGRPVSATLAPMAARVVIYTDGISERTNPRRPLYGEKRIQKFIEADQSENLETMLEALLDKNYYAGIGEFHAFGDDIELPVLKKVIELASRHHIFLHAHSDSSAVENIFAYDENAIVLWAHSGFETSAEIDRMLSQYPNLWADLAFRYEHESDGRVMPEWRELFLKHPDRFMLGTDTYTPERWFYVIEHATNARRWLDDLPPGVAENIAWKNAETLLQATR